MVKWSFDSKEMTLENPIDQKDFVDFENWNVMNMGTVQMPQLE